MSYFSIITLPLKVLLSILSSRVWKRASCCFMLYVYENQRHVKHVLARCTTVLEPWLHVQA